MSSIFAAVFDIPVDSTLTLKHLERQALHLLTDLIPDGVQVTGPWSFQDRGTLLYCEAPATGPVDVQAALALADRVHNVEPAMSAWIRRSLSRAEVAA